MSQIYKTTSSTPSVATSYVSDAGTAVPVANILNVLGANGVSTSGSGNTLTISLSNACEATGQTVGAVTTNITCISIGTTPGTFSFRINVSGYVTVGADAGDGIGYFFAGVVRTDGATATLIGVPDKFGFEDVSLLGADVSISVSVNNLIIQVTGIAGNTIEWSALTNGTFAS
jgi:hypothetical protein